MHFKIQHLAKPSMHLLVTKPHSLGKKHSSALVQIVRIVPLDQLPCINFQCFWVILGIS